MGSKNMGNSQHGGYVGTGHDMNQPLGCDSTPGLGRGRGFNKGQSRKEFPSSHNGIGKKGSDDILQFLNTEILIKEISSNDLTQIIFSDVSLPMDVIDSGPWQVERVFGASKPDPVEREQAKKLLKEHEQVLADTLERLADISYSESDEVGHFSAINGMRLKNLKSRWKLVEQNGHESTFR